MTVLSSIMVHYICESTISMTVYMYMHIYIHTHTHVCICVFVTCSQFPTIILLEIYSKCTCTQIIPTMQCNIDKQVKMLVTTIFCKAHPNCTHITCDMHTIFVASKVDMKKTATVIYSFDQKRKL